MIDHVFNDGSVSHQFEVGDRVINTKPQYSLYGREMDGYVGAEGTVDSIEPYNRENFSHYTSFLWVSINGKLRVKELNCFFKPSHGTTARKIIKVKD